ncbi:putative preprocathepsin c precursor [Besnoitia besnoiti]|uniref:Putative preprocathepsin c n=1 Tax=Besnoitia besnoiti TaxID=94643 RepID=A0A2A9MG08_BESBE|nr:putative preprocathepsin c precursor [Besnoitia besnoiti]PFH36859.1 putative preprocathepsin c precursor [Besnoitia besnoiti]
MKISFFSVVAAGGLGLSDVLGVWTFTIGTDRSERPTSCGGGAPNSNLENLQPELSNYASWLTSQGQLENKIVLTLTDKLLRRNNDVAPRNQWTYLAVTLPSNPDAPVGTWTMVYDEGFEKRFEILFDKLFPGTSPTLFESLLSAQSILSCSPYNQGCDGGYPFLVGKHAKEFGLGTTQCQKYAASHDPRIAPCEMNIGAVKRTPEHSARGCGPDDRWYAKDYNYVGGFYEGCSGEKMMDEIYHHGPVVVAIDAPDTLFMYQSGLFNAQPSEHGKICDIPKQGFNGWEYTNHAVAVVGWGEDA